MPPIALKEFDSFPDHIEGFCDFYEKAIDEIKTDASITGLGPNATPDYNKDNSSFICAFSEDTLVGFIAYYLIEYDLDDVNMWIQTVYVSKEFRCKEIALSMIKRLSEIVPDLNLLLGTGRKNIPMLKCALSAGMFVEQVYGPDEIVCMSLER